MTTLEQRSRADTPRLEAGQGLTRREWMAGLLGSVPLGAAGRPEGILIDTHVHLFAADKSRFPYHPDAPYDPPLADLRSYKPLIEKAKIDHVIIVHPEPYQDDHRYLEHCFKNEPSPGFFKGTCLFDPIDPDTPGRIEDLVHRNRGRIVGLRIHQMGEPGEYATTSGAIKNRDLRHPGMKNTWHKMHELGLAIQMHFRPHYARQIHEIASQFEGVPVILDHLGRAGMGTAAEYEDVLKLAELPRTYMKFSGVRHSSKQDPPYLDVKPIVEKAYEAFGADRMIWGGLGKSMAEFEQAVEVFETLLEGVSESDRAKIRGLTAMKLFGFLGS